MSTVKRLVLDVLKPHQPNALDFAESITDQAPNYRVTLKVTEVDEKTETTVVTIEGDNIEYDKIVDLISNMGGSIHSIDEVVVVGQELSE